MYIFVFEISIYALRNACKLDCGAVWISTAGDCLFVSWTSDYTGTGTGFSMNVFAGTYGVSGSTLLTGSSCAWPCSAAQCQGSSSSSYSCTFSPSTTSCSLPCSTCCANVYAHAHACTYCLFVFWFSL